MALDRKDLEILRLLQVDGKLTAKEIARKLDIPITTVYAKVKRMEGTKLITGYRAILDGKSLGLGVTAFVFISVSYKPGTKLLSQRKIAEEIAKHPEVQEVQIISGEWDLLLKVKAKDVDEIGKFIVDDLRKIEGVDKTSTVVSLATVKESTALKV